MHENDDKLLWNYALGICSFAEKKYVENLIENDTSLKIKLERYQILLSNNVGDIKLSRDKLLSQVQLVQESNFEQIALELFRYQAASNKVYKEYLERIHCNIKIIDSIYQIPFLPIDLFKTHDVKTDEWQEAKVFLSSGTSGSCRSRHAVRDTVLYDQSIENGLKEILPNIEQYHIVAHLPSYADNAQSSLLYMIDYLMNKNKEKSHKYLHESQEIVNYLIHSEEENVLLVGVSFALFELCEYIGMYDKKITIIETGGLKTSGLMLSKLEIITRLQAAFPKATIISEFGMTELLSQAYSTSDCIYKPSTTLKVLVDDPQLVLDDLKPSGRGRLNFIDLYNIDSCAFIQSNDIGCLHDNGSFEVYGRIHESDLRGCQQLM